MDILSASDPSIDDVLSLCCLPYCDLCLFFNTRIISVYLTTVKYTNPFNCQTASVVFKLERWRNRDAFAYSSSFGGRRCISSYIHNNTVDWHGLVGDFLVHVVVGVGRLDSRAMVVLQCFQWEHQIKCTRRTASVIQNAKCL